MHNLRNCARKAHKHPIIDIYLPIVGRIYPIPEYIRQLLQNISNTRNSFLRSSQSDSLRGDHLCIVYQICLFDLLCNPCMLHHDYWYLWNKWERRRIYPPIVAEYIQYQNISANCWQNISNIRIFPQLLAKYIQYKYIL